MELKMNWRAFAKSLLRKAGYDIVRYPLMRYMRQYEIDVVLDIGANVGQFALELRGLGYGGRIVSFEPLASAYQSLSRQAESDPAWKAVHMGIGRHAADAILHIADRSPSSSLLPMLPRHSRNSSTAYVGTEKITLRPLDELFDDYVQPGERVFLKIDTQGSEREVLEGAIHSLARVTGLQMEMSLLPLYEGEALAEELIAMVRSHGLTPVWLDHGFKEPSTQQLLQVDGLFFRAGHDES